MGEEANPESVRQSDSMKWVGLAGVLSLILMIWFADWSGPYGPLEAREWYRREFWPDRHANLYILTDSPTWNYGEVKSCMPVKDIGKRLQTLHPWLRPEDLLACAGFLPMEEYMTRETFAVTFKEKGYESNLWDCLKTPEGIICK